MLRIYKASAGSGKTFTLTRQYLKLLLGYRTEAGIWELRKAPDGANRHILAITFTNKATQEMIDRIISELAILAHRQPGHTKKSDYLDYFIDLFNTDEQTLANIASETLDDLLADFVFFHVSTIDSFFQNVLRTFAREIDMPDNFEIELSDDASIRLGISDLFDSINLRVTDDPVASNRRKWIAKWLRDFMNRQLDEGKAVNLFVRSSGNFNGLVKNFELYFDETFRMNVRPIMKYLAKPERIESFKKALRDKIDSMVTDIVNAANKLKDSEDFMGINNNIRPQIENAVSNRSKLNCNDTMINAIDDRDKRYLKKFKDKYGSPENYPADLDSLLLSFLIGVRDYCDLKARTKVIIPALGQFGLIGALVNAIERRCKENNLILISNTNTLLRGIINDDDTPFVYERIGYYLRHFLIDEFQDTSCMQWENLKPLVMESLSHSHENLVIGDEKQCIYRFRDSDPDLLAHRVEADVTESRGKDDVKVEGTKLPENNNWRSSEEVVKFNNSFFFSLGGIIGDKSYEHVIQQISDKRDKEIPGHVMLIYQNNDDTKSDDANAIAATANANAATANANAATANANAATANANAADGNNGDGDEQSADAVDFALLHTTEQIDRLLDFGYSFSDIAILVRTHKEARKVIMHLLDHEHNGRKMEITSSDNITLGLSPTIRMIVEILRLTQIPQVVKTKIPEEEELRDAVNPAFKRTRLLYCYQYYLHRPVELPDGSSRRATPAEALTQALETLRKPNSFASQIDEEALKGHTQEIDNMLRFERQQLMGEAENDNSAPATTLSTIIDRIIDRFIIPANRSKDASFIIAFQDLVYNFCAQGNSDIRSFLEMWDRKGRNTRISTGNEDASIKVMTIHQSKGLEFPCVIIPFANNAYVQHNSLWQKVNEWFKLDKKYFRGIPEALVPPMLPLDFNSSLGDIDAFKDQYKDYVRQQKVDALNNTYVAFTRAVNELIVISPTKDKSKESLYSYIPDVIKNMSSEKIRENKVLDDDTRDWVLPLPAYFDGSVLEIGTPTRKTDNKKDDDKKDDDKKDASKDGPETLYINVADYDPQVNDQLTMLTKLDTKMFNYNDPRHRGDFLHRVLSRVRRPDDLDHSLTRAARNARLTPEQTEECAAVLRRALADPRVAPWFDGYERVIRERPIADGDSIYRPDRVVWTADGHVDVIDFKFGDEESEHRDQVANYANLLCRTGQTNVRAFLWYIPTAVITQVPLP